MQQVWEDLFGSVGRVGSLGAFQPELVLCATLVAMLAVRMLLPRWRHSAYYVSVAGLAAALALVVCTGLPSGPQEIFTGMLVQDGLAWYLRGLLLLGALVVVSLTAVSRVPPEEGYLEFYFLLVGATLGMCLMVSANHLVMVMIGIEMASICSYVLAGILRRQRQAMEAALKYAVFGAATAAVMLYGMSLLAACLGSVHLPTMVRGLADRLSDLQEPEAGAGYRCVLLLGGVMFLVGLGFKLAAFPLHFWAPDVLQGAPAEVGGFLSVVSKTAALGLLARLAQVLSAPTGPVETAAICQWVQQLEPARQTAAALLAVLAAVTCTFGNLAAYGQTNMKRLMAYSTIAHAGYMIMPIAAMLAAAGQDLTAAQNALASLLFYTTVYLWMNLGVFGFVALVRDRSGREEIETYRALGRRSPGVTALMAVQLFSLVGLPPLAGFMAKFTVFASLWQCGFGGLLLVAVLNTVLSLFYYLRVIRVMTAVGDGASAAENASKPSKGPEAGGPSANPPETKASTEPPGARASSDPGAAEAGANLPGVEAGSAKPPSKHDGPNLTGRPALADEPELPILSWAGVWLLVVCVPVIVLGVWWNGLFTLAQAAAARSW